MKRTPIIPIKWIHDQHDTDQDGVPNYKDCNPWNPYEHLWSKEEIETCWKCDKEFYPTGTRHCPFCGAFIKTKVII